MASITLTEGAQKKAKALAEREGKRPILRMGVKGGGCAGLSYFLDFVEAPSPKDEVIELDGLTVICDPKSLAVLDGTQLDYETNLMRRGFRFKNPNAKRSCSCGDSFQPPKPRGSPP